MKAAATAGMAIPEVLRRNRDLGTTIARTDPCGPVAPVWAAHVDDEFANPDASHIHGSHGDNLELCNSRDNER